MKRILALDGGGIRGIFTLQILARVEQLFRELRGNPELVLADEYDLFAGTSTGAIIGTCLCWGMSVQEVEQIYLEHGQAMFQRSPWHQFKWKAKFQAKAVGDVLKSILKEDDAERSPALLRTKKLRCLLLVLLGNATTGSPWPITNNPRAKYNDESLPQDKCNLNLPLWQLLRASTAAPTFFAPESVDMASQRYLFVDGAVSPYNNPALIAVLVATLPQYRLEWPASRTEIHLTSIGTGSTTNKLPNISPAKIHNLHHAGFVPNALIGSVGEQQDLMCRVLGDCRFGPPIDSELGSLLEPTLYGPGEQKFTYVRYDRRLDVPDESDAPRAVGKIAIDDLKQIPWLQVAGRAYAAANVRMEHLFPQQ